jgi:hypothetical protein
LQQVLLGLGVGLALFRWQQVCLDFVLCIQCWELIHAVLAQIVVVAVAVNKECLT